MLLGRSTELDQLNRYYDRSGSQIVVIYGQKNTGKTALMKEFIINKPAVFYLARSCSEREQAYQWGAELRTKGIAISEYPSYEEIFASVFVEKPAKTVLIIDEFQNMLKTGSAFMKELVSFVHGQESEKETLILLCSSSVGWVENSMLKKLGETAHSLSGLMKIKGLKFRDCRKFFPGFSGQQCMEAYAILGGLPGLWMHFQDGRSVRENIIRSMLTITGPLYTEAERLLSEELRETAVYNTILASIAGGRHKLNDLYRHTGFSRAKISVYLKNLMELEIVEKVFSYDTAGYANVQKGIYRIRNHFIHFYYKFLYPHMNSLALNAPEAFYADFVEDGLKAYIAEYFKDICMEHIEEMNKRELLPFVYDRAGEWVGKAGNIDIIVQDEEEHTLLALCNYDKPVMPYEDYERLLYCAAKARLNTGHVYLYSAGRFDEKLYLEAKVKKNLTLVSMKEL